MSDTIRVFVNGTPVELPGGSVVASALRAFDPKLEEGVAHGTAFVTDGRGIEIASTTPLSWGAILRVAVRARRGVDADS